MKTVKIGIMVLLMAIGNFVMGQQSDNKTPEERATMHSKKLSQQLGLNADQEKSVYSACLQRAQQQEADKAKYQGDREAMKNARKQNNDTFDASISKVLTADQKTKYEQVKQEEKDKRRGEGK